MDEAGYEDVSEDDRGLGEVAPDRWFHPDHLPGGLKMQLKIQKVYKDPDDESKLILAFSNDPRWLGLSRENKLVLQSLFGSAAKAIGQTVFVTASPNWRRVQVIKLLRERPKAAKGRGRRAKGEDTPRVSPGMDIRSAASEIEL